MESISKEINSELYYYSTDKIIINAIQSNPIECIEKKHIIMIDDFIINNSKNLDDLITNFYSKEIFNENTKIHIKLKLNIREYLIISNLFFPAFFKAKEYTANKW